MPLGRRPSRAALAVNRRMFLKAAALGMSVPAAMRLARMATAATTTPPKRFLLMYIPHGTADDPEKNAVTPVAALFGGQTTTPPVIADVQLRKDLLAFTASEVQGLQTTLQSRTAENTKLATHLAAIQSLQADGNVVMPP